MTGAKYCEQCGAALAASVRFCEACGAAVPDMPTAPARDAEMTCPNCGLAISALRVSRLFEASVGDVLHAGLANLSPDERETLVAQLAPPRPPTAPNVGFWLLVPFVPCINVVMVWWAPTGRAIKLILVVLGLLFTIGWGFRFHAETTHVTPAEFLTDEYPSLGPISVLDTPFLVLPVFLLVYAAGVIFQGRRRQKQLAAVDLPQWQRSVDRWRDLYFCAKCRCVFPPHSSGVAPENVASLLEMRQSCD